MRIVITAGGTAGHINPALAIADEIMRREPGSDILFIGRKEGMERKLVAERGYRLEEIEAHGFMRRLSLENIVFNVKSFFNIFAAERAAGKIIKDFSPDAVLGCGGYVSGPVVKRAAKLGYPTIIQEQNAFPGMTTKLLAKHADRIFVADQSAVARVGYADKCEVVGNPVRRAFFDADREAARASLGVGDRTCVLSYGGSNGAKAINEVALAFIKAHIETGEVYHIHATGQYTAASFDEGLRAIGVERDNPNLHISEYIDDMPVCYAAADLIICRAGAITVSELAAAGRASVLIPSPNVTENHQYYNALSLAEAGAAFVYEEKELDTGALAARLMELVADRGYLREMGARAKTKAFFDSAGRIYEGIRQLADSR